MNSSQPYTHSLRWEPPEHVAIRKRGVYILHGAGEHAGRYEKFAQQLTQAGYRVGAHDHPGHGKSSGKRGVIDPPGGLVTQAAIQCQQFALETGSAPILFGHSMGGLAAAELVLEHKLPVAALILSTPAFKPFIGTRDRMQVNFLKHFAPTLTVERPYRATRLTHDENVRKQSESDPLNHGYKSASLVSWLLTSGSRQLAAAKSLTVETLLLIATADPVVDPLSMQAFAKAAGDKVTVHEYKGYLHEILNETPERAVRVRNDIEQWLVGRYPELQG